MEAFTVRGVRTGVRRRVPREVTSGGVVIHRPGNVSLLVIVDGGIGVGSDRDTSLARGCFPVVSPLSLLRNPESPDVTVGPSVNPIVFPTVTGTGDVFSFGRSSRPRNYTDPTSSRQVDRDTLPVVTTVPECPDSS